MTPTNKKVAVITGASRGIGRGIAEDGFLVVVHFGQSRNSAAETVTSIESNGGSAFALRADLASIAEIRRFFAELDDELKARTGSNQLDILVNNAGIASPASYREMTPEQFDHLFAVNLRAAFLMAQAAILRMRGGGRIINISSVASRRASPTPVVAAYSMTKAASDAFTVALAQDLGGRQITANTIAPGSVLTDANSRYLEDPNIRKGIETQTALGRIGDVRDIANLARFLASERSQWVTGEYIAAGGGYRL
jgi:3-oxoacyl-[acyl-carrier protein] reductase